MSTLNNHLFAIGAWLGSVIDGKLIVTGLFGFFTYRLGQSGRFDQAGVLSVFVALIGLWGVASAASSPAVRTFVSKGLRKD